MRKPTDGPRVTAAQLRQDLLQLGVEAGMVLVVHSSLRAIGWVAGGAPAVVQALIDVLGEDGTLVMPAATPQCADAAAPLFDRASTPTTMGAIAEAVRCRPGTLRSDHPLESVCAHGRHAAAVTASQPLAFSEGRGGPWDQLHDLHASILLLGVGFNRCTALHFAESLVTRRRVANVRWPVLQDGRRAWVEVPNVADDNDTHFPIIGQRYAAAARRAAHGRIGQATATLMPMRDLVAFAVAYFDAEL